MKKDLRVKQIRARKNFFPTLVATIILWVGAILMVVLTDPAGFGAVPFFFFLIFMALLFTSATLFENRRRGLLVSLGLTLFLVLRYFGVGNILNFLLLSGVIITYDILASR